MTLRPGVLEWIPYDYEVDVPYIYKTCTVKLVNKNLSHLLFNVMSHEQVGHVRGIHQHPRQHA